MKLLLRIILPILSPFFLCNPRSRCIGSDNIFLRKRGNSISFSFTTQISNDVSGIFFHKINFEIKSVPIFQRIFFTEEKKFLPSLAVDYLRKNCPRTNCEYIIRKFPQTKIGCWNCRRSDALRSSLEILGSIRQWRFQTIGE